MALTLTEKAARLGISTNYLSLIYNGRRKPSLKLAESWKPILDKNYKWWCKATTSQIQRTLDAIGA